MKIKKNSYPPVNVGSSFMLVILVILCMVVFAMLSLSGALRDQRYSTKTVDRTTSYYHANNLAEEKLSEIDQILFDISKETHLYTKDYQNIAISTLKDIEGIQVSADGHTENAILIEYTVPVGETESLDIKLTANNSQADTDGYYSILQWKQINTKEWNGDSTLPLLKITP